MQTIEDLVGILTLKKIDDTIFEGENYQAPWGRVFGGQVLGQSLHAAYQTVPKERVAPRCTDILFLGETCSIPSVMKLIRFETGGALLREGLLQNRTGKPFSTWQLHFR